MPLSLITDAIAGCSPPRSAAAPPSFEEVHAEWVRYHAALAVSGAIDPGGAHAGQYLAFFDGRVIGYGPDPVELRGRAAEALNIHPERLVIAYLDA